EPGVVIEAVEPALIAAFNGARRELPDSCWFAAAEAERIALGLLRDGHWVHLASERCAGEPQAVLARLQARESLLIGADAPDRGLPCFMARWDASANVVLERCEARPAAARPAAASEGST
ncbi:MAG: hypothetical protein WBO23_05930, partial [Burkholderiales bacterium]